MLVKEDVWGQLSHPSWRPALRLTLDSTLLPKLEGMAVGIRGGGNVDLWKFPEGASGGHLDASLGAISCFSPLHQIQETDPGGLQWRNPVLA